MSEKVEQFEELFARYVNDFGKTPILGVNEDEDNLMIDFDSKFLDKAKDDLEVSDDELSLVISNFVTDLISNELENMREAREENIEKGENDEV